MTSRPRLVTVDHLWSGRWAGRTVLRLDAHGVAPAGREEARGAVAHLLPHLPGTVLAPFTDSHVHLGLVDAAQLPAGGISRVVDLGWDPAVAATWLAPTDEGPEVRIAGGLLAAPGGYPARASWAPARATLAVRGLTASGRARRARTLVQRMHDLGATIVKVTLNADVGPVLDDAALRAVVDAAHDVGLPVTAHVQGVGQAARALAAGVDQFAHAPFSERLDDDLVAALAAATTWVSTLAIHDGATHETAFDNVARFRAAGGRVLYGTDLGNGDQRIGVSAPELRALGRAGLGLAALLGALAPDAVHGGAPAAPTAAPEEADATTLRLPDRRVTWIPSAPGASGSPDERAAWLASARAVTADELAALAGPPVPHPTSDRPQEAP